MLRLVLDNTHRDAGNRMDAKSRIVIVDDHALFRASLRALLQHDFEVVGEAANGAEAIRVVGRLAPQLVLMDLMMPGVNGIKATEDIRRFHPNIRILMLSVHQADSYVEASLQAGADGYILKDDTYDELGSAIRCILAGKSYVSPNIMRHAL
jgi:DNA-binding NarL/FixJ family response regulator